MTNLLEWSTVRVGGPDATTFLDGQLSQDLTTVTDGGWSLLLEPTGEVVAALYVRQVDGTWELLGPRATMDRVGSRLRRFKIRVNAEISDEVVAVATPMETYDDLFEARWPWAHEFSREVAPHSFGAGVVAACVSFTKGCFTGQELVGRMDARGATMPWRFVIVEGDELDDMSQLVSASGPPTGSALTTTWEHDGRWRALGFAHRSLFADGPVVRRGASVVEEVR